MKLIKSCGIINKLSLLHKRLEGVPPSNLAQSRPHEINDRKESDLDKVKYTMNERKRENLPRQGMINMIVGGAIDGDSN